MKKPIVTSPNLSTIFFKNNFQKSHIIDPGEFDASSRSDYHKSQNSSAPDNEVYT